MKFRVIYLVYGSFRKCYGNGCSGFRPIRLFAEKRTIRLFYLKTEKALILVNAFSMPGKAKLDGLAAANTAANDATFHRARENDRQSDFAVFRYALNEKKSLCGIRTGGI